MTFRQKAAGVLRRVGGAYVWSVAGDWREVRENAGRLSERLKGLRNRQYRSERFAEAVERLGLTEAALRKRQDQLSGLAVLYEVIAGLALLFIMAAPFSEHPINHALMSIGVAGVAGAKFLAARFRVAQIRARELFGFKDWLFGRVGQW